MIQQQPTERSLRLANINVAKRTTDLATDTTYMEALKDFHAVFRAANHCYDDLVPFLNDLSPERLTFFLNSIDPGLPKPANEDASTSREILLYLKLLLRYHLSVSPSANALLDFSKNALKLYAVSTDQRQVLPEACFLAVVTLSKLGEGTDDHLTGTFTHLLPCIMLLRHCLQSSEDFFPAQLLLIRLYLLIGSVSLAFIQFKKLSVKNMQWETLGHLITNRISTIHPIASGSRMPSEDTKFSPSEGLETTISVADNSQRLLTRGIMQGLNLGSYANVLEAVQIRLQAASSFNTQIALVEKRDVEIMNGTTDTSPPNRREGDLNDRREVSTFSILDDLDASWTDPLQVAPVQREAWLAVMLFQGELWQWSNEDKSSEKGFSTESFTLSEKSLEETSQMLSKHDREFTRSEKTAFVCYNAIASAILASKNRDKSRTTSASKHIRIICEWLEQRRDDNFETGTTVDLRIPNWNYLHEVLHRCESSPLLSTVHLIITPDRALDKLRCKIQNGHRVIRRCSKNRRALS